MTDSELIQERIEALKESVEYFTNKNKTEREIWVAQSFIKNLNIEHEDSEFITPERDPPDVIFRDIEFEIKEILDSDRRRHSEYKEELEKARSITDPQELLSLYRPIDKNITEIYQLCLEATHAITKYPPAVRESTDLLYYVNLQHVEGLFETPYPDTSELKLLGWRSVSFVMGHRSCVLTTRLEASDIIVKAAHPIHHRYYHG